MFTIEGKKAALRKLGFNPQDAGKLFKATRKYKLPKPGQRQFLRDVPKVVAESRGFPEAESAFRKGYNAPTAIKPLNKGRQAYAPYDQFLEDVKTQVDSPNIHTLTDSLKKTYNPEVSAEGRAIAAYGPMTSKGVFLTGEGDASKGIQRVSQIQGNEALRSKIENLNPENRRMLNAVLEGHEMDELKVAPRAALRHLGHFSPEVILREHNKLVTLPSANAPVRDVLQMMREGENIAFSPYLQLGHGERLSRHARKRITQLMEQDLTDKSIRAFKAMNSQ